MEELKFSPSPAVWKNLETELDKEKKRRRPVFWFFLFAGIGLGAAMIYITTSHRQLHPMQPTGSVTAINPGNRTTMPGDQGSKNISSDNARLPYQNNSISGQQAEPICRHKKHLHKLAGLPSGNNAAVAFSSKKDQGSLIKDQDNISSVDSGQETASVKNTAVEKNNPAVVDSSAGVAAKPLPDLQKRDSVTAIVKSKKTFTSKPKGWKIGLVFSPGISAQQSALFTNASFTVKPVNSIMAFSVPQSYSAAPYFPSVYSFRPAFSWSAGFTARRILSAHWDVAGAVTYHYSSTMVTAGASAANAYLGLFLNSSGNKQTDYRNSFHFIDIPVSAGYTLNKNSRLPVRLEGGLLVSEFLSGKGLQFDNGVYYGKYNTLNKTQLSATAGIQVGMVSGRNVFELGPQIQYGLTDLMRATGVSAQHLFFGGITLRVMRKTK